MLSRLIELLYVVVPGIFGDRIAATEDGGLSMLGEELRKRDSVLAVSPVSRGHGSGGFITEQAIAVSGLRLDAVVEAATSLIRRAAAPAPSPASHQTGDPPSLVVPDGQRPTSSQRGSEVGMGQTTGSQPKAVNSTPSTVTGVFRTIAIKGFPNVKDEAELLPLRELLSDCVLRAIKRRKHSN